MAAFVGLVVVAGLVVLLWPSSSKPNNTQPKSTSSLVISSLDSTQLKELPQDVNKTVTISGPITEVGNTFYVTGKGALVQLDLSQVKEDTMTLIDKSSSNTQVTGVLTEATPSSPIILKVESLKL